MANAKPVTKEEFAAAMAALGLSPKGGPYAVAVSGGADSMALALLFADWGTARYLTFDHKLRPESTKEARQVQAWLQDRGLDCTILTWQGKKPASNIEALARDARYRALKGWCRENGAECLIVAHTMSDQAETFLMRLFRGSGVDGLAAMAPIRGQNPKLVRPLLSLTRARLVSTLKEKGQVWIEDPSNENFDFMRVKVRALLANSEIEGLDIKTLAETAGRMARVRAALDEMTTALLKQAATIHEEGYVTLDFKKIQGANEEIGLRALSKTLMFVAQSDYPPRFGALERLYGDLGGKAFKGATLHGCQLVSGAKDMVEVCREAAGLNHETRLAPGEKILWDGRFEVALKQGPKHAVVKALAAGHWQQMVEKHPELKDKPMPFPARIALPGVFLEDEVVAIPQLGFALDGLEAAVRFSPGKPLYPEGF